MPQLQIIGKEYGRHKNIDDANQQCILWPHFDLGPGKIWRHPHIYSIRTNKVSMLLGSTCL